MKKQNKQLLIGLGVVVGIVIAVMLLSSTSSGSKFPKDLTEVQSLAYCINDGNQCVTDSSMILCGNDQSDSAIMAIKFPFMEGYEGDSFKDCKELFDKINRDGMQLTEFLKIDNQMIYKTEEENQYITCNDKTGIAIVLVDEGQDKMINNFIAQINKGSPWDCKTLPSLSIFS